MTPDSFSDGNKWYQTEHAVDHGIRLAKQGADLLDLGGESTRPGSVLISSTEEIRRIEPVIKELIAKTKLPLSVDTRKAEVAEHVLDLGVNMINDISGFLGDPEMADLIANYHSKPKFVLMFNAAIARPEHKSSQNFPNFCTKNKFKPFTPSEYMKLLEADILDVMKYYYDKALNLAINAGVDQTQIYLDPGIGFALTEKENLILLKNLNLIRQIGFKVFLGVSRKRFLVKTLQKNLIDSDSETSEGLLIRDQASAAITAIAATQGIEIVRTHTVNEHLIASSIGSAIFQANSVENSTLGQDNN